MLNKIYELWKLRMLVVWNFVQYESKSEFYRMLTDSTWLSVFQKLFIYFLQNNNKPLITKSYNAEIYVIINKKNNAIESGKFKALSYN